MAVECGFQSEMTKTFFTEIMSPFMFGKITEQPTKVLDAGVMLFEIEKVDFSWKIALAHVQVGSALDPHHRNNCKR